jgi:gamma-glutamyl phosphate reductase
MQARPAYCERLKFDEQKLPTSTRKSSLIGLPEPLEQALVVSGIAAYLYKSNLPIGVLGVSFESRPTPWSKRNVCLKTGTGAILKGGSEAANTQDPFRDHPRSRINAGVLPVLTLIEIRLKSVSF